MLLAFILLILVVLALVYYKKKTPHTSSKASTSTERQQQRIQSMIDSTKYWGFYIEPRDEKNCCTSVLALRKKHFPINSVPALPLDDCSKKICHCKHVGLVEKRRPVYQRRRTNDRRGSIRFEEVSDRRSHSDRRSSNWVQHRH